MRIRLEAVACAERRGVTAVNHWVFWLVIGILSIVGGILALLNPFAATLTAETLAGWLFVLVGILEVVAAFRATGWGSRIWAILLGVVAVVLGLNLLANPLGGAVALTIVIAVMLLASGITKVILAFGYRGRRSFWPILLSGAVSVALALIVFGNLAAAAVTLLGVLLAVELISNGVTLVLVALALREVASLRHA